jgi:hypothetical protein
MIDEDNPKGSTVSKLMIKLSEAARSEGRAAVRIRRLADLQGNMDDTWVHTTLRIGFDAKADVARPTSVAKADEDGDVFIRRMDARDRHWVRYLRDGVPVIAAIPLGTENRDLPAMRFDEENPDVSVTVVERGDPILQGGEEMRSR